MTGGSCVDEEEEYGVEASMLSSTELSRRVAEEGSPWMRACRRMLLITLK